MRNAVFERLALSVQTGEGRQERRMDVDDRVGEGANEDRREQAVESREADELDLALPQHLDDALVERFTCS